MQIGVWKRQVCGALSGNEEIQPKTPAMWVWLNEWAFDQVNLGKDDYIDSGFIHFDWFTSQTERCVKRNLLRVLIILNKK